LQELLVVGSCCVLFRQSDIYIGGWDLRSWTLVSNGAFAVFFTGQQGLDIVVTLGYNLGKDMAGYVWLVLVGRSFMAFLAFEYLMLVSLGA
jgi:hypothetical protein